jgi:hypothetical protein
MLPAFETQLTTAPVTLARLLAERPLDLAEALRYALLLAEALRSVHDEGRSHAALLPANIIITSTSVKLIDPPSHPAAITPYTAPELLRGQTPDARSDVFAFGAIVYEMISGQRAFMGASAESLSVSIAGTTPQPLGSAELDHLINHCLAKDPTARYQRMLRVILELKLLVVGANRTEALVRQQNATAAAREESRQLETRVMAILQSQEKALAELQQAASDTTSELRRQLTAAEARIHELEEILKSQHEAIASVVAGQAQADDLVEGVVAAMELLQASVFPMNEEQLVS